MPELRNMRGLADKEKAKRILQLGLYLDDVRRPWEPTLIELAQLGLPRFSDWEISPERGDRGRPLNSELFDTTMQDDIDKASNGFIGYTAPEHSPWFKAGLANKEIENLPRIRTFIQDTQTALYDELASRTDFYSMMSEAMPIALCLGTPTCYQEESFDGTRQVFTVPHPREMWIYENRQGVVDTHYRRYPMTLDDLVDEHGDRLPQKLRERAERNPYDELVVVHAVTPRKDRDSRSIDKLNKPWASYKVLEDEDLLLDEGGFDFNPFTTLRFQKNSGEHYARTWGWKARPLALRLNEIGKTLLRTAHRAADPTVRYPAGMEDDLDLDPGGRIPYQDPTRPIEAIDLTGNYPIGRDRELALEDQIHQIFMIPFWLTLQQLQTQRRGGSGFPTATQVMELQGERAAVLVSVANRVYSEWLMPILVKTWQMASRAGRMPEVPGVLRELGITGLMIEFTGPLAQLQRRFQAFQGTQRVLGQILPISEVWPEVRDKVNADELVEHIMEEGDFPQRAINDDRTVARIRRVQAEGAARRQALEEAEIASKIAPALPSLQQITAQPGLPANLPGVPAA